MRVGVEEFDQVFRLDKFRDGMLREVTPFIVEPEAVGDDNI